jgi:hypothetical protein
MARAPIAGTMHFLVEGATFLVPGVALLLGPPSTALQPEALCKFSGSHVAVEAIVRGMMPLLSFADFADRMFMPDGHFELPLVHAPEASIGSTPYLSSTFGRLAEAFTVASTFLSIEPPQKRASGEGRKPPLQLRAHDSSDHCWED